MVIRDPKLTREDAFWPFIRYHKYENGSESGGEILSRRSTVRWWRSKEAIEAGKKLKDAN